MDSISDYPELVAGLGIGMIIAIVAGVIFIFWLFNIFCMMAGAHIANINKRSFWKAFVASILISWLGGTVITALSFINPILGLLGLLLVPALFIKLVYSCGLGQAIVAYIINIITSVGLTLALIITLILGLGLSVDKLKKQDNGNSSRTESVTE